MGKPPPAVRWLIPCSAPRRKAPRPGWRRSSRALRSQNPPTWRGKTICGSPWSTRPHRAREIPCCGSHRRKLRAEAKASALAADVEFVNQIAYYSRPCAAVQHAADSTRADSVDKAKKIARTDSIARADAIAKTAAAETKKRKTVAKTEPPKPVAKSESPAPEAKKESSAPVAAETKGRIWSVQVAAYNSREEAQGLAKKLGDRGFDARITNEKPFRVRIGRDRSEER